MTKMSAWPGARSPGRRARGPRDRPRRRASAPPGDAAHARRPDDRVRRGSNSSPMRTPSASQCVTACPSRTSTPSALGAPRPCSATAVPESSRGRRGPASTRSTRVCAGSIARKSRASARRASSATAPASSTPVGPPPTITIVSRRALSSGFDAISARSKASRMPPADRGRVVERLEAGRVHGPFVAAEVAVRRAGREHEEVVGDRPGRPAARPCARGRPP